MPAITTTARATRKAALQGGCLGLRGDIAGAIDMHTSDNISWLGQPGIRMYDGKYTTKEFITVTNSTILSGTRVELAAGDYIELNTGFEAQSGSDFVAEIKDCELGCGNGPKMPVFLNDSEASYEEKVLNNEDVKLFPNPLNSSLNILSTTNNFDFIKVFDILGRELLYFEFPLTKFHTVSLELLEQGTYILYIGNFQNGKYLFHRLIQKN